MAVGKLLEIGGERQHLDARRPQLIGQFVDQFGTVDQNQPSTLFAHALGHTPADALGRAGDDGDLVLKTCVHLPNLWNGEEFGGQCGAVAHPTVGCQALAANFS